MGKKEFADTYHQTPVFAPRTLACKNLSHKILNTFASFFLSGRPAAPSFHFVQQNFKSLLSPECIFKKPLSAPFQLMMSGRGNPHRGGMGSDGLPPRTLTHTHISSFKRANRPLGRDPFAVREQEGLGLHWSMLRAEAGLAIRRALTGNDPEHQAAIEESLQFLERFPREQDENDAELMVRLLSVFLDRIGPERQREGGMDAMDAIFWMTDAEWNEEVAINALTAAEEQDQNTEEYEESSEEEVEEGIRPEPEAPVSHTHPLKKA